LEQLAELLGVELNEYQKLVAINDMEWIPGLQKAGVADDVITVIRQSDRCAQGVTPDDEAQAVRDIENLVAKGKKISLVCATNAISAYADRFYFNPGFEELLLILPAKAVYFGSRNNEIHNHIKGLGLVMYEPQYSQKTMA
jgi:hypothetical protein